MNYNGFFIKNYGHYTIYSYNKRKKKVANISIGSPTI